MSATTSDGNTPYINQMLGPYQPFGEICSKQSTNETFIRVDNKSRRY